MLFLWAILWGLSTAAATWLVIRFWLPKLAQLHTDPASSDESELKPNPGQYMPRMKVFQNNVWQWILIAGVGLFAAVCGYMAADFAASAVSFIRLWLGFAVLACIAVTDLELFIIPNKCSLVLIAGSVILLLVQWLLDGVFPMQEGISCAVSGTVTLVILLVMSAVTRGGVGMGDVKILSALAFLCGFRMACYVLTLSLMLCAVSSVVFLLTKKKQLKDLLPLGPFMWVAMGLLVLMRII